MYKGFYNLASGIITQQRVLNTVANNVTNTATPGYKRDVMATSTFRDVITARTGNVDKGKTVIGQTSSLRTVSSLDTIYTQGALEPTSRVFDFAISGSGFFQVATENGYVYTRNGAFTLDDDGFLVLQDVGRVLGEGGPIWLASDDFSVSANGTITMGNGANAGRLNIVDFDDYAVLAKNDDGLFTAPANAAQVETDATIQWMALEASNADMTSETTAMIEAQRAFQSSSQLLRMYDALDEKSQEVARL